MKIYKLVHIHDIDDYIVPDIKHLGYFSDVEKVKNAISFFVSLPGFSSYPNGFVVTSHNISYAKKSKDYFVYELCCSIHDKNWDYEYENVISIHATQKDAKDAKREFKMLNKMENGILNSKLNKDIWIDARRVDEMSVFWNEGFNVED